MFPTDCHYLFNIAEEMQFPAARCAQGNSVCMYGKSASSGVETMNRANEGIHQKTACGHSQCNSDLTQEGKYQVQQTLKSSIESCTFFKSKWDGIDGRSI